MTKIKFNPSTFTIDINGHAEHVKEGEDIVCSAISILFYTLAESLTNCKDMLDDIVVENEDGNGHISCKPKPQYERNISLIYWTILNGFQLMAKHYEKNVTLECSGVEDKK